MTVRVPFHIPYSVIRERGPLSPMQAICIHLCDDPDGPQLSQRDAAKLLGVKHHQNVGTHLERARRHKEANRA